MTEGASNENARTSGLTFVALGVSHRHADAEIRDRVTMDGTRATAFLDRLSAAGIGQGMVLSTCNRCEVFCCCAPELAGTAAALYAAEFPEVALGPRLEVRCGDDALTYLCRIAAGLESMILGEYQILGQVKDAYFAAQAVGRVGKAFDRILRDVLTCAKRVKTDLDIGAVPPSVCRAGIELVERRCGIAGKRVFVIGSGKTGTLAVRFVRASGAKSVTVCNRSIERTRHLVEGYGARAVGYDERYAAIAESDIVISATASPHVVVRADQVRLDHPVAFLDLASPRDVDPALDENPLATVMSIDTIGELAAGDRAERERLTAKGMEIVRVAVDETLRWLKSLRNR